MTDRKISPDPLFAGPAGGTATRLCKRPELARERLELGDLRASASGSRLDGEEWTYRASAQIEAGLTRTQVDVVEEVGKLSLPHGAAHRLLNPEGPECFATRGSMGNRRTP